MKRWLFATVLFHFLWRLFRNCKVFYLVCVERKLTMLPRIQVLWSCVKSLNLLKMWPLQRCLTSELWRAWPLHKYMYLTSAKVFDIWNYVKDWPLLKCVTYASAKYWMSAGVWPLPWKKKLCVWPLCMMSVLISDLCGRVWPLHKWTLYVTSVFLLIGVVVTIWKVLNRQRSQ